MTVQTRLLDLIILGQVTIDFFGEQLGSTLANMISFKKYVGGFGGTLAIASKRLGMHSALLSQTGKDEMGKSIRNNLIQENIDISHLYTHENSKTTIQIRAIENRTCFPEESFNEKCAYWALTEEQIETQWISNSKILCINSQDLNPHLNRQVRKAIIGAKDHQVKIAMLISHKAKEDEISFETVLPLCSLVFVNMDTLCNVFGKQSKHEALMHLRSLTNATILVKDNLGCYAFTHNIPQDWQICFIPNPCQIDHYFEANTIEAFMAGFLSEYVQSNPIDACCLKGLYCSQIVQSRQSHSDAMPTQEEVTLFMAQQNQIVVQTLASPHFEHVHYVATRPNLQKRLFAFSFGYHEQWEKIGARYNASANTVNQLKYLVAKGIQNCKSDAVSIICDETPQMNLLESFSENWIARTVETPNEIPLKILGDEVSHMLLQWPRNHGAKVTIAYHPDDKYALRGQQESTLSLLYRACRATNHELLIEIAPPSNAIQTPSTIAHIIRRFYEIGIYPDWWQIATPRDPRSWDGIQKIIDESDKYCKGVLMIAQSAQMEQLKLIFQHNVNYPACKGFVVGKNIIQQPIEDWLAHKIADSTLIEQITFAFEQVISLYHQAQETRQQALQETIA